MKSLKRILALLLCLIMSVSVFACGGEDNTDNNGSTNNGVDNDSTNGGNENDANGDGVEDGSVDEQIQAVYTLYVSAVENNGGTPMTYEEWLITIKGAVGEKGDKGDKGDTGATGAQGPQGEKGDKGDTGATGAQGPQGEKGDKGDTGATGAQGPQGEKGDKGDTGATGAQGPQGEKGDKGDTGATGAQGPQGEKGDKGDTGATGAQGPQGEKGDKGDTGATGAQGPQGEKGDKGDTGATGAQGPQGEKGDKGDTGATGAQGPQGEKGDKGDTGATGAQGPQGEKGDKGDKGDQGLQGVGIKTMYVTNGSLFVQLTDGTIIDLGIMSNIICKHAYGEFVVGSLATCTSMGYASRSCAICGNVEYQFLNALGHDNEIKGEFSSEEHMVGCNNCGTLSLDCHSNSGSYYPAYWYDEGYHYYYCDCGAEVLEKCSKITNAIEYDSDLHIGKCEDCGQTIYQEHNLNITEKNSNGHIGACTQCSYVSPLLPHVNDDGECTYFSDQTHTYNCDVCDLLVYTPHVFNCSDGKLCACGFENPNPPTVIQIQGFEAGVNLDWLRSLTKEFEATYANTSFRPGEMGVRFKIEGVSFTDSESMQNYNIHFFVSHGADGADDPSKLAKQGKLINIDDAVTEKIDTRYDENGDPYLVSIKDKILPNYYNEHLAYNGDCYGVPSYGITTGLTFDAYHFKYYGLYLADPTWVADNPGQEGVLYNTYNSKFGTCTFIAASGDGQLLDGVKLACGNDGVYGTWDDGQPTSLTEFFILCDYMKSEFNIYPLTAYGASHSKRNELVRDFGASLAGYAGWQSQYSFDSGNEEVEVITGWTNEATWWDAAPYIKKPITEKVKITMANGNKANDIVSRYYAISVLQVAYQEGWYSLWSADRNIHHLEAEEKFVLNGMNGNPVCGMLIEGNYWYNESRKYGTMDRFPKVAMYDRPGVTEPDVQWMSLPTKITGTVEPNADQTVFNEYVEAQNAGASMFLNAKFKDDAGLVDLLKEFMQYINTDDALSFYTGSQGVFRAGMNYDVKGEDWANLSSFQKSYVHARSTATRVVEPVKYNGLYANAYQQVTINGNSDYYSSFEREGYSSTANARQLFEASRISDTAWVQMLVNRVK